MLTSRVSAAVPALKSLPLETALSIIIDAAQGKTVGLHLPDWNAYPPAWRDLHILFSTGAFCEATFELSSGLVRFASGGKIQFVITGHTFESQPPEFEAMALAGWQ